MKMFVGMEGGSKRARERCHCHMKMSGSCQIEMSGYMVRRKKSHERGHFIDEQARSGPFEGGP